MERPKPTPTPTKEELIRVLDNCPTFRILNYEQKIKFMNAFDEKIKFSILIKYIDSISTTRRKFWFKCIKKELNNVTNQPIISIYDG